MIRATATSKEHQFLKQARPAVLVIQCFIARINIQTKLARSLRQSCTKKSTVPRRTTPMIVGCIGTPSDVSSQSETTYIVRLAFLSPQERSLRSIFLHEGPLGRRAHHNHRLANLCTINMAATRLVRCADVAVSSTNTIKARAPHGDGFARCCQQLFSNTQIFVPLLYLFPTITVFPFLYFYLFSFLLLPFLSFFCCLLYML